MNTTDILVTIFTGILTLVAVLQYLNLIETVKLTRNDQRAWIGAVSPQGNIDLTETQIKVDVILKNFGKSPALKVRHQYHLSMMPPPKTPSVKTIDTIRNGSCSVLQPGEEQKARVRSTFEGDVRELLSGSRQIYFFGEITYEDVFDKEHHTRYAYSLSGTEKAWEILDYYNDAD